MSPGLFLFTPLETFQRPYLRGVSIDLTLITIEPVDNTFGVSNGVNPML